MQGLKAARRALETAASGEQQADAAELDARLLLRTGNAAAARVQAERALALAAASAQRAGDPAGAAGLYLRAGRSAAAQGDAANARLWLHDAMASSTDPALLRAAQQVLADTNDTGS